MAIQLAKEDSWNLDSTLASVLAQGLEMLINGPAEQVVGITMAQHIFDKYAQRWDLGIEMNYHDNTSRESIELRWALGWLSKNFMTLWD
jgi:hypothetical protein